MLQCKQEFKIPGLYVIDSIVRQSRYQFGADKDVFAPRFSKNILVTFYHVFKCPAELKVSAIIQNQAYTNIKLSITEVYKYKAEYNCKARYQEYVYF